jgi:hypothetical protein
MVHYYNCIGIDIDIGAAIGIAIAIEIAFGIAHNEGSAEWA